MKSIEDLDRAPREQKPGAELLIEESTGRVIYCGCVVPIRGRYKKRHTKSFLLMRTLCWSALYGKTPWVTTDVLVDALWEPDTVDDPYRQLYTYMTEVREAFSKLVGMHIKGFRSVPPIEDWHWILEGDGRQLRINYAPEKIDIAWQFTISPVVIEQTSRN
jgi:hypothetical protein